MSKRKDQKELTRNNILQSAKGLFISRGFLKTTTQDIVKKAGIAQGTLFLHFQNKENLIIEIFDLELSKITNSLHNILSSSKGIKELLTNYLDFIEGEEDIFSVTAIEFPFYSETLQRQIIFRESAIKNYFYNSIKEEKMAGKIKNDIDITMTLTFLFGTINYFLCNRNIISNSKSIIGEKKESIINTFMLLILI